MVLYLEGFSQEIDKWGIRFMELVNRIYSQFKKNKKKLNIIYGREKIISSNFLIKMELQLVVVVAVNMDCL